MHCVRDFRADNIRPYTEYDYKNQQRRGDPVWSPEKTHTAAKRTATRAVPTNPVLTKHNKSVSKSHKLTVYIFLSKIGQFNPKEYRSLRHNY